VRTPRTAKFSFLQSKARLAFSYRRSVRSIAATACASPHGFADRRGALAHRAVVERRFDPNGKRIRGDRAVWQRLRGEAARLRGGSKIARARRASKGTSSRRRALASRAANQEGIGKVLECPVRADTKPSPVVLVRTLSRPFPPFGQLSLSARHVDAEAELIRVGDAFSEPAHWVPTALGRGVEVEIDAEIVEIRANAPPVAKQMFVTLRRRCSRESRRCPASRSAS
jgi:hypothetical protein